MPRRAQASMVMGSSGSGHVDGDAGAGFEFGEIAEHGGNFVTRL